MIEPVENEVLNNPVPKVQIDWELYKRLRKLGILVREDDDTRDYNIGLSDYSKHIIQPWAIWLEYDLNAWDADIIKRVLRTKRGESRESDYNKIIHDCKERLRQLEEEHEN
jgi:hypothetical protein